MRDLFEEIFANRPLDPTEAARRGMRPHWRRRFYARAEVAEGEGGFAVLLDGRPVKTPARTRQASPTKSQPHSNADATEGRRDGVDAAPIPVTRRSPASSAR